jgi:acetolactate synthase-1/2/3 large subunit
MEVVELAIGADLVISGIRKQGIQQIFSLNGGHISWLYKACVDYHVSILDVRHEESAAYMAYASARFTGRPAVVVVTAGPGVTNTVTGISTAYQAAVPMVVIGGRSPIPQTGMGALQEMDQVSLMRPITKMAETVLDADQIPLWINRAFRVATTGRPGPVFLEIPPELLRKEVKEVEAIEHSFVNSLPFPDHDKVDEVIGLLASAKRPLILAGGGVFFSGASEQLRSFVEQMNIPVLTNPLNRGVFPGNHELHMAGARSLAMAKADLVLLLGIRLNFILAYGQPPRFARDAHFIQVDIDPEEIGRNRSIDVGIQADVKNFLVALQNRMNNCTFSDQYDSWVQELHEVDGRKKIVLEEQMKTEERPIHPMRLCYEVRKLLTDDTTLILDGGDILSYGRVIFTRNQPGYYVDPGPFGTMGVGVASAIAAKSIRPHSPVIAVIGDGALGMGLMEMDTAIRHNLPIVIVVSNNAGWNIERQALGMDFGEKYQVGTTLSLTRYDRVVVELGGYGEWIDDPNEIYPALQRALSSGKPALINVHTSRDVISPDLARGLAQIPEKQALNYKTVDELISN